MPKNYVTLPYDPAEQSYLSWLYDSEATQQELYTQYREYYDGNHDTKLTDRIKKFLELKEGQEFNINYCPLVVDALAERLVVTGFNADEQSELFWEWWVANRMDAESGITHTAAIRDGDAFVLVEWDVDNNRPLFTFEMACASQEGVKVHYDDENRKRVDHASKRWIVKQPGDAGKRRRLNLYYADHIEKYISKNEENEGNWQPYLDKGAKQLPGELGDCGWYWHTHDRTEKGNPLGVPVAHFKNLDHGYDRGVSELKNVLPIQNALNKTMIDLVATADVCAFPLLVGLGDDFSDINIGPGVIISSNKPPDKVSVNKIPGEDLKPLIALKDSFAVDIARITRTPLSYFQISGQMPAEGAEKQREAGLVARAENRQVHYGNAWENAMNIARRLHNAFGSGDQLDENQSISTQWKEAQTRNEKEHLETLLIKSKLGVDDETIWSEMGYNAEDIAKFQRVKLRKEARVIRDNAEAAVSMDNNNQENGNNPEAESEPIPTPA